MWLNKWVHKLFLQCWSRSFFNLKPVSVIVYQFQTVRFIQMMSLTFGLFTQVSGSGPLGPLVSNSPWRPSWIVNLHKYEIVPFKDHCNQIWIRYIHIFSRYWHLSKIGLVTHSRSLWPYSAVIFFYFHNFEYQGSINVSVKFISNYI